MSDHTLLIALRSLPMRERGLKYNRGDDGLNERERRSPCGSVD